MNRLITGRIATFHLCSTALSKKNLLLENIASENILITGNTVIDSLHWVINKIGKSIEMKEFLNAVISNAGYNLLALNDNRKLVLITGHRRENFGDGFFNICHAIKKLSEKYPEVDFVYPVHLNPNVRKPVMEILGDCQAKENVYLIEPLDYLPFVFLMSKSYLLLTDSGGIQEEAPGLGKPVLVMRDTTERPEAVESGTVMLVGTEKNKIEKAVSDLIENKSLYLLMSKAENPYGDGKASQRIVEFFLNN